jgi:pectate lyase
MVSFCVAACSGTTDGAPAGNVGGTTVVASPGVAGSPGVAAGATGGGTVDSGGSGGIYAGSGGRGAGTGGAGAAVGGIGANGSGGVRVLGSGGSASGGRAGGPSASGGNGPGSSNGGSSGCSTPPEPETLVGWATTAPGTTGGGAATPMQVTTLAELNAALAGTGPAVVWLKGSVTGDVKLGSNKTLVGVCGAELHGHVEVSGSSNVIIRNLTIVGYGVGDCSLDPSYDATLGCSSGSDAISVWKNAHHIWIDHCDISDGTDGNLDITLGSNYVTVSWTKFHYSPRTDNSGSDSTGASGHRFSNLVGGTDTPPSTYDDAGTLNVTWHHDWWADNVVERQPRVRFGKNHVFNSLFTSTSAKYCVRAGIDAHLLVESNVFVGVANPQQFNNASDQTTAFITASNNLYTKTSGTQATGGGGTAFTTPPYAYTADPTADLQAAIQAGAGPH